MLHIPALIAVLQAVFCVPETNDVRSGSGVCTASSDPVMVTKHVDESMHDNLNAQTCARKHDQVAACMNKL